MAYWGKAISGNPYSLDGAAVFGTRIPCSRQTNASKTTHNAIKDATGGFTGQATSGVVTTWAADKHVTTGRVTYGDGRGIPQSYSINSRP